jgi:putative ABC transport system ATP-binding protein
MHLKMIELIDIYKEYNTGHTSVRALRGITCNLPTGKTISIVGKSGCGKSTLLNILGGLDRPSQGKVRINKQEINKLKSNKLADYRKLNIGMVFQSFNLIHSLSSWENVAIALAIGDIPRSRRKNIAMDLLSMVDLRERATHLPAELSGGERQRVAIARALANNPQIILADEPTGNLDSDTSLKVMHLLKNLNNKYGKSIIMVTHDKDYAREFSDIILTMKDGRIIDTFVIDKD